jgi:DNA polymerase V
MKKARAQKSLTKGIGIFISTSRFSKTDPYYYASKYLKLPFATLDTGEIASSCRQLLLQIYKSGYSFNQAGVVLSDFIQQDAYQYHILDTKNRTKQYKLATAIDSIENKFGYGTVSLGIQGTEKGNWASDHIGSKTDNFYIFYCISICNKYVSNRF